MLAAVTDGLRRSHYPADRNRLAAHLTLFHHLPPSLESELRRRLTEAARAARPRAEATGLINLGTGTAIRVVSPELEAIRAELAEAFTGLLMPPDLADWRPHVTVQNKVSPAAARALRTELGDRFAHRPVRIDGLGLWSYRDGAWDPLSRHMFRA